MRSSSLPFAALVWTLALTPSALGQIPAPNGMQMRGEQPRTTEVVVEAEPVAEDVVEAPPPSEVFAAVGEAPRATIEPVATADVTLDPTKTAETLTNAMLNAAGGWDPTLGRLTTGDGTIDALIVESGTRHGVDPKLVFAVMNQESTFKKNAVSPKGACGFMQLMPDTARRFGVTNIFDPKQNIDAGAKYLRFLLDLFHNDVELALAGYNAGEYRVIREGYRVPAIRETQNYVRLITSKYYGRAKRNFQVTFGRSIITDKDRDAIQSAALVSQDDRGTDSLSNLN